MLSMNTQQQKALEILQNGGVIAYPTDTTYGIGCAILSPAAVKRIFEIKGRNFNKPLSIACSSLKMATKYSETDNLPADFLNKVFPGPVTLLLPKTDSISDLVTAESLRVGVRIPDYPEILEIIEALGEPIVTTSANISGQPDVVEFDDVKLEVDYIYEGTCHYKQPSTIIDIEHKKILREGVNAKYYQRVIQQYL